MGLRGKGRRVLQGKSFLEVIDRNNKANVKEITVPGIKQSQCGMLPYRLAILVCVCVLAENSQIAGVFMSQFGCRASVEIILPIMVYSRAFWEDSTRP